jgi:hypothetical protein
VGHEIVDRSGKLLMEQRDVAILQHEWAVRGSGRTEGFADRHAASSRLTEGERAVVRREVIESVDKAIHQILFTFEQRDLIGFDVMFGSARSGTSAGLTRAAQDRREPYGLLPRRIARKPRGVRTRTGGSSVSVTSRSPDTSTCACSAASAKR